MATPNIIQFTTPIQSDAGGTSFRIRTLTIDMKDPMLVKFLLQEASPETGEFVENGKTYSVRNEGDAALQLLMRPEYAAVLATLPTALVEGPNLPGPASLVEPTVVSPEPTPEPPPPPSVEP